MKQVMQYASGENTIFAVIMAISLVCLLIPGTAYASKEIKDQDITRAIDSNLLWDDAVSSHLIDVQTTNGIVTLSGSVDTILARDRAVKIVESIKGVRSVVNRIEVRPVFVSDKEISKNVQDALLLDPVTESYQIDVKVKDGQVILSGKVESWTERQIASQLAKGVKGVKDVRNNIAILYAQKRSDYEITTEIKRRLHLDPFVNEALIQVQVKDGAVDLSGGVGSLAEKSHAYADAWVAGVKSVNCDDLEVKWWLDDELKREDKYTHKSDLELEQAIKDALLYDPRTFSFNVGVSVNNGIATLTGIVDNLAAKNAAEQDAKNTIGVNSVYNLIKVRPENAPSDDKLKKDITKAMADDPIVDRFDISVTVLNQKAYLYGIVDSAYEKVRAESVASSVDGIVDVSNNLTIRPFEWTWKSDDKIRSDIQSEYFWSFLVDGDDINVSVVNGTAILTGSVEDWSEYYAAIDNAFEGGALDVKTSLNVESADDAKTDGYYESPLWNFDYPLL
ncbi:MAG: BON domain-containing protein [Nitrospirota bacterium]